MLLYVCFQIFRKYLKGTSKHRADVIKFVPALTNHADMFECVLYKDEFLNRKKDIVSLQKISVIVNVIGTVR
jgi:hypothetical protein